MIVFKKRLVSVGETWFDEEPQGSQADAIQYRQRTMPIPGTHYDEFYTITIDLSQDTEKLLAAMNKTTRNEIKHAGTKDALIHEHVGMPTENQISEFCEFFDHFALGKGIERINQSQLHSYAEQGVLALARVKTKDDETLVWRAFYCTPDRMRQLFSASHFRDGGNIDPRLVGRANRYCIWCCMLKFKADGVLLYDQGGWYAGKDDEAKLRINKFKEGFGGTIVKNFDGDYGVTLKGKLYLRARRVEVLRRAVKSIGLLPY